jgi:hypothetical protein
MSRRIFPLVAAMALSALAAPASAQIIATSIPKEFTGSGKAGTPEKKWAFHVMGSPFAKWNINSYFQEPTGVDDPLVQNVTSTDSGSKFIFAAEAAFKAGDNVTFGVGGWYNELGTAELDFFQLTLDPSDPNLLRYGVAPYELRIYEVHANAFYKDFGVQAGMVRNRYRQKGLRAGTVEVDCVDSRCSSTETFRYREDANFDADIQLVTNWDAFLIYKKGFNTGKSMNWGVSVGSGFYRDGEAKTTVFTGFATATVGLYKGLGLDVSFWYVGNAEMTAARRDFQELLDDRIKSDVSRFTVGLGYTFSK